jgi:hypothetical protein
MPPKRAVDAADAAMKGVAVRKFFAGSGWYNGTVEKVHARKTAPFRVVYEDGDEEDMDRAT